MKIKVNYDFTQRELFGDSDIFEVADAAKLGDFLRLIDARIMEAGKNKGPENILEHELHDGDTVEFVYGFCGG